MDLAKNNIGNLGLQKIAKALQRNTNLVSLDLGSNDIMNQGSALLFNVVKNHPTLSALTIANHDRMHRNRISVQACNELYELLAEN